MGELVDEPRLADAGFTRDQHGHGRADGSRAKCRVEACSLRGPADQDRAGRPPRHGDTLPPHPGADHVHIAALGTHPGDGIARRN
jgi:hypothetical protein